MATERERMLAGELYNPHDPELVAARARARNLCLDLNGTREEEVERRRDLVRRIFGSGGETVWLQPPFFCDYGEHIHLGEGVFFNFNCVVLDVCEVRVGARTLFGSAVQVMTPMHPMDAMERRTKEYGKPIAIGEDCWIGSGAIVCPGVTIGDRVVIGAGSVVTRNLPSDVFAAGNPCRVIREIGGARPGSPG